MKTICYHFLACCIFVMIGADKTSAQKQGHVVIDSLLTELAKAKEDTNKVNILYELCFRVRDLNDLELALKYGEEGFQLANRLKYKKGIAGALGNMGSIYNLQGDYNEAIKKQMAALQIRQEINDKEGIARSYLHLGNVYSSKDNLSEALKNYYAALKNFEITGYKKGIAGVFQSIGGIYSYQGNYKEAKENYLLSLKVREEIGDSVELAQSYNSIGMSINGNPTESLEYYFSALKIYELAGVRAPVWGLAWTHGLIASAYNEQADSAYLAGNQTIVLAKLLEALKNFLSALDGWKKIKDDQGIAEQYNALGNQYMRLENYSKARQYLGNALVLSQSISYKKVIWHSCRSLSLLDSIQGNYEQALAHYKMSILYRDSIFNEESTKKSLQSKMQYDFDKKEATTKAEQDKKDVLAKAQLKQQRNVRNFSLAGAGGLLLFLSVVVRQRNRVRKEKKRSDELLLNILPAETAEELKATGTAAARDFDEVTVLFTDFKDFTQASEKMTAHELVKEIHYYFSEFDRIISNHNIEKIKTIGDSYMAAGGLPTANKTNAADTVSAALEIQAFMHQIKQQKQNENKIFFDIRIGVNTGPVIAGIVGIKKFAYDIWGDTVNIASRMESSGEEGKVNISGTTYELIKEKFHCTYRGKVLAKHKGEIDMYFVEGQS